MEVSKELADLLFFALDHGVNSIREGGVLVPFVVSDTGGKRKLDRFVSDPYEHALSDAKTAVSKLPSVVSRYALAYDGFITVEGKKYDAIIINGAEREKGNATLLAQRYLPAVEGGKRLELVGNPAFIGRESTLFAK